MRQKSLQLVLLVLSGLVGGIISGLIFNPSALFAQKGRTVEKVIEAQEFRLVDADGNVRAKLGNFGDGSGLEIYGKDGKLKIDIKELITDARAITFYDNKGQMRAILGVNKGGDVSELSLGINDNKKSKITLETISDGVSGLYLNRKNGEPRIKLTAVDNGLAGIGIHQDNNGVMRAAFILTEDGSVGLNLLDSSGKARNMVAVGSDGRPTHQMDDKNKRFWEAP